MVAGVRNCSWQHRKNNSLWCPSSSTWAIVSRAGRSRSRKLHQIPTLVPTAGGPVYPQLPAAISEPNKRCFSLCNSQVNGRDPPPDLFLALLGSTSRCTLNADPALSPLRQSRSSNTKRPEMSILGVLSPHANFHTASTLYSGKMSHRKAVMSHSSLSRRSSPAPKQQCRTRPSLLRRTHYAEIRSVALREQVLRNRPITYRSVGHVAVVSIETIAEDPIQRRRAGRTGPRRRQELLQEGVLDSLILRLVETNPQRVQAMTGFK